MKLIIEPDHGVAQLASAIKNAKESIEITIFRFDRNDIEEALKAAAARGVKVTALVAYANRGGQKLLRKLEMHFLEAGMTVARTADDLIRYHNKLMIVDRKILFVLAFNFTHLDIARSRCFGISTENPRLVQETAKLFEADCTRTPYTAGLPTLVVSPANSRKELGAFLRAAKKQLLIYDPEISDKEMLRILKERTKEGVEVRIIGHAKNADSFQVGELSKLRLHTRTIVRDGSQAFIGSQSLRALELDQRREVGVIFNESRIVKSLIATFEGDWKGLRPAEPKVSDVDSPKTNREVESEKVAQVLIKELHPIAATVKKAVKKVVAKAGDEALHDQKVKDTVKKVVKRAVKDAVKEVVREAKYA